MLAASSAEGPPRYRRAVTYAHRLHAALPELAVGVSSLSNRLLPYLFPTVDDRSYDAVLDQAYGVQRPPPALDTDHWVTSFDELHEVAARRFFTPEVRKRVVVVLSDAETRLFDARGVLRDLQHRGTTPIVVRFWRSNERIFRHDGAPESYRATQGDELRKLRDAGWQAYAETEFDAVVRGIRRTVGSGPVARVGYLRRETSIAPMLALAALAPLLLVLAPAGRLPSRPRLRRRSQTTGPALLDR
jgi:hypothetical protein